jgi:hypothetical protein
VLFLAVGLASQNFTLMLIMYGLCGIGYPFFTYWFLVWFLAGSPAPGLR